VTGALAVTTAAYALGLGLWCLAGALLRRPLGRGRLAAVAVLQAAALGHALAAGAAVLLGHRPAELATHLGYLIASVGVLPVALAAGRRADGPDPAVVGIAGVALCVIVMRAQATGAAA
jgi:hypothetical protein